MGGGKAALRGGQSGARSGKKLIRDIRAALKGADVPGPASSCPGLECCGFLAEGDDPCRGCALRSSGGGEYVANYALFLAGYMETFRPHPAEIGWRDYEIYQAFVKARQEYLAERQREALRRAGGGIHGRRFT